MTGKSNVNSFVDNNNIPTPPENFSILRTPHEIFLDQIRITGHRYFEKKWMNLLITAYWVGGKPVGYSG